MQNHLQELTKQAAEKKAQDAAIQEQLMTVESGLVELTPVFQSGPGHEAEIAEWLQQLKTWRQMLAAAASSQPKLRERTQQLEEELSINETQLQVSNERRLY